MHQCSNVFATHHLLQVSIGIHVEDDDREVVLLAHRGSRQIHDLEATRIDFIVGDIRKFSSRRVFFRIGFKTVFLNLSKLIQ